MYNLTVENLCQQAQLFSDLESRHPEPTLYGVTDGKKIGTYLEHKFQQFLLNRGFIFQEGNSADGIDFPGLNVDIKVTSCTQPQSSCPYRSAWQKVYGLGYSLLVFVYQKTNSDAHRTSNLYITDTIFIEQNQTADFQTTSGLLKILDNQGNQDDVIAFLYERSLQLDDMGIITLASEIMRRPPQLGYLTISNAMQWRLKYTRAIEKAGAVDGLFALYRGTAA